MGSVNPNPTRGTQPLPTLPEATTTAGAAPAPPATEQQGPLVPFTDNYSGIPSPSAQTSFALVENEPPDFDAQLSEIQAITDPEAQQAQLATLFDTAIEAGEHESALKALQHMPADQEELRYGQLIQDMLDRGDYNKALELNDNYPNTELKDKNVTYIVRFLVENGETIAAAQARGEGNLAGVIKAEWDSAMSWAENKYERVVDDVLDWFRKESLADQIAEEALKDVGNQYRQGYLGGGRLACAHTVSRVLDNFPELTSVESNEVNSLVSQLKSEAGFTLVAGDANRPQTTVRGFDDYQPGDVVVFSRPRKRGYGHVGIISRIREDGTVMMVHNSSSRRQVVEIPMLRYKAPTGVLRLGE